MIVRLLVVVFACCMVAMPVKAQDSFDPQAEFEAFWSLYDEHYALFDVKEVDWQAIGNIYRPEVKQNTTRAELFAIFEAAIDHLNDIHVTVRDEKEDRFARSGGRSIGTAEFQDGTFDMPLIESAYIDGELFTGGGGTMRWGRIGGIGYWRISSFSYPTTSAASADRALELFADAPAVIVDVRHNGGGSDAVARAITGRFADIERLVMTSWRRIPGQGFTEAGEWHVGPSGAAAFTDRVILLIDDRTISAAENFAILMREFPHVTIVGETSAGTLADTYEHHIGDGWVFGVPQTLLRDARGHSWEGIGVVPNLWQSGSATTIAAGKDAALDLAIAFARASRKK